MKIKYLHIFISALLLAGLSACEKFLDIEPKGSVIPQTEEQYRALITNAYSRFPTDRGLAMFRSDEVQLDTADSFGETSYFDIYTWNDNAQADFTASFQWKDYYHIIYLANHIIDELANADGLSSGLAQIVGEAYCLRAYAHFTLACLFAPPYADATLGEPAVPLALNTNTEVVLSRSTVAEVYASVASDIAQAQAYLNVQRPAVSTAYRWTQQAAWAFGSRLNLYMGQWQRAIDDANRALMLGGALINLNQSVMMLPCDYRSPETILALDFVVTPDYRKATRPANDLINLFRATDDLRFKDITFKEESPGAYRIAIDATTSAYRTTFRVAELLLNKAEAYAQLGNADSARACLFTLKRTRLKPAYFTTDSTAVAALNGDALLQAVLDERARELAFQGHRWFDLRRTSQKRLLHEHKGKLYVLPQADSRYTIPIPKEARESNALL